MNTITEYTWVYYMFLDVTVFLAALLVSVIAGWVMHRSDYCIAGMFRDLFIVGITPRLRSIVVLIFASMALFHIGYYAGILGDLPFPWYGPLSLAPLPGGFLFGIGMVLAGGCVVGTLYHMGSGSTTSMVAFAGIVAGSLIFVFTAPYWQPIHRFLMIGGAVTVSESLGVHQLFLALPILMAGVLLLRRWWRQKMLLSPVYAEGYIQPLWAALFLAFFSSILYYLTNATAGVTSSYTKFGAALVKLVAPDFYDTVPLFHAEAVRYINTLTGNAVAGGLGAGWDGIYYVQIPVIAGIVLGAFVSSKIIGEFHIMPRVPLRQYLSALAGGILLGYSSRIALGCNVWHLMGGLPLLAWNGLLFLPGMILGARVGTWFLTRFVVV